MKILILFLFSFSVEAFILNDPNYRLKNPSEVVVNIASGACRDNGMSDDELKTAITKAIDEFWNTVSESRLWMELGTEVDQSVLPFSEAPEQEGSILIGCVNMGADAASGSAVNYASNGSTKIQLNADQLVPGGYTADGLSNLIIHEMGHGVGLSHSKDPASVMTYEDNDWGARPASLSHDDIDGVIYLYPYEKEALGLFGGCSVIASEGTKRPESQRANWPYLLVILLPWAFLRIARRLKA
jgi:hypothetical protein